MKKPDEIKLDALTYLYKHQKRAKLSLDQAERHGDCEAAENLKKKLTVLDWLIGLAIKEDGNENA